jgi:hypothetical protein
VRVALRQPRLALALALSAVTAAGCGYRPAAAQLEGESRRALVPAFVSSLAYPELDVWASSYLGSRLTPMGIRTTSDPRRAECTIQGTLLEARERPVVLGADQTLVELVVDVRIAVSEASGGPACETRVAQGRASMAVPLGAVSEGERQMALQLAASEAIDALLLETLLCARPAGGGRADPVEEP